VNPYEDQMEELKKYTKEFLDGSTSLHCVFCKLDYPKAILHRVYVSECILVCVCVSCVRVFGCSGVCVCVCPYVL